MRPVARGLQIAAVALALAAVGDALAGRTGNLPIFSQTLVARFPVRALDFLPEMVGASTRFA